MVVAFLAWPVASLYPRVGIDFSWQLGLHLATHSSLQYGRDVVFTYGPYGFLSAPMLVFAWMGVLSLLYTVAVVVGFSTTVVHLGRRSMTLIGGVVIAYFGLLFMYFDPSEVAIFVLFLWCLAWVTARDRPTPSWFPYAGGAFAALQLLIKFDTGILAFLIVAITVSARGERRSRAALAALLSFAIAFLALWIAAGQHLGNIPVFARRSIQVASGYSSAMGTEEPHRVAEYLVILFALGVVLPLILVATRLGRKRILVTSALVLLTVYAEALHGFIRHDYYHSTPFLILAAVIPAAVRWPTRFRAVVGAFVALPILVVGVLPAGRTLAREWNRRPVNAMNELRLLVDSPFRRSLASGARQAARDSLELDTAGLGIVEGHTVAIDPVEVSIVWAYGLQWQPYPVYQTYSAYTDTLDELNADALSSASGPQFVLRQGPLHAIDGRYPLFESPAYELALTCNFTAQHFTSHWEVLRRVPSLCGKPRLLSTVSVAASTLLTVPRAGPNDMVVARFYVHQSLFERLLAKLFKPRGSPRITIDSKSFRFLTGTADEPHILCVPSSARLTEYGGGVCASTIALDGAGSVEVRFYAIRFS